MAFAVMSNHLGSGEVNGVSQRTVQRVTNLASSLNLG
jgi:hypothetical protein